MLPAELETEIAELARRFGPPRRVAVELNGAPFEPLCMTDRFGEVCMVLRRSSGRLLTAIKTFYPSGAFRLLTGGISPGEPIEHALLREIDEETGLEVVIRRFLAVIEYRLVKAPTDPQSPNPIPYSFVTFAFLLDELGGTLESRDPDERVATFREIGIAELPALAETLARIDDRFDPEIDGSWADWGRFRAVVHRVVHQVLLPNVE
jgi:8-oxo-dGTP pyrophosphatase MutT (NUDIX family)